MDDNTLATAVMDLLDTLDPNGELTLTRAINKTVVEVLLNQVQA